MRHHIRSRAQEDVLEHEGHQFAARSGDQDDERRAIARLEEEKADHGKHDETKHSGSADGRDIEQRVFNPRRSDRPRRIIGLAKRR